MEIPRKAEEDDAEKNPEGLQGEGSTWATAAGTQGTRYVCLYKVSGTCGQHPFAVMLGF